MRDRGGRLAVCLTLVSALLTAGSFAGPKQIELPDGSTITTLVERPPGTATNGFPLCVLLPGGAGTESLAKYALHGLGREFVKRGWVVAVPVSPGPPGQAQTTAPGGAGLRRLKPLAILIAAGRGSLDVAPDAVRCRS